MTLNRLLIPFVLCIVLIGCGPSEIELVKKEVDGNLAVADSALKSLTSNLQSSRLRNASLIPSYASAARKSKPEFSQIIDTLASEGTSRGPTFLAIENRLKEASQGVARGFDSVPAGSALNLELLNIQTAIANYDAMLVDPLNMLADFSEGRLPKLREIEFESGNATKGAVGSEYVGNSNYGEWRRDSSGNSFWHWYGQYAFFSMMFGNRPVYYDSWSGSRRASYYHDRNRGAYSSPRARKNQADTLNRTKKSYTAKGKAFKSPYSKNTRIKGVANSSKSSNVSKPFRSSYAKSGSSSKSYKSGYNSRSSGSRRSSFGGK